MRTRRRSNRRSVLMSLLKLVKLFALLMLTYLLQVCVMPYFAIGGITPSLILVVIAIVTVAYGRIRAFWAGAFFGIVLEVMQPTRAMINLMLYPVCALLGAVIFADKSTQQLEYERSIGKAGRNASPLLRTLLCTLFNVTVYDVVNITYIYLRGASITAVNIGRGLLSVFLTVLLCLILMIPLRRFLGLRVVREEIKEPKPYLE